MRHQVTVKELGDFLQSQEMIFACDVKDGEKKSLYVTLDGFLKVYHNSELVLITRESIEAISKYNSL